MPVPEKQISLEEHTRELEPELAKLICAIGDLTVPLQNEFPHRLMGVANAPNKYGEAVSELDTWANGFLCDSLIKTGFVRKIYSEELEKPLTYNDSAPFVVTLDPLDGSSNIASNNPFGTIVGIYRKDLPCKGKELVASLFKLYGPITTIVLAAKRGVHEYVKHHTGSAKYMLLHEKMKLPPKGKVIGFGGDITDYPEGIYAYTKTLVKQKKLKVRYCGAFVGDFSQVLHYGGLFMYPTLKSKPEGKLRLAYEGIPMGNIMEQAGGASSNGKVSLLDIMPKDVDERTPVYVGNKDIISGITKALR
jgi:fructose-1,6-bisphosphatase I